MDFTQTSIDPVRLQVSIRRLRRLCSISSRVELSQFLAVIENKVPLRLLVPAYCRDLVARECDDEALETFAALLNEPVVRRDRELTCYVHHVLAAVYRRRGNFALAVIHQQSAGRAPFLVPEPIGFDRFAASELCSTEMPLLTRADLLSGWGQDAMIEGQFALARQYFSQALYWEIQVQNLSGEADDWGNLGVLEGVTGNPRLGIRHLWKAYSLHRRCGDESAQVHDLMNLAVLYEQVDRTRFSLALLRRAKTCLGTLDLPGSSRKLESLIRRMRHLNVLQHAVASHN